MERARRLTPRRATPPRAQKQSFWQAPSPQSVVPNGHFTVSDMPVDTGEQLTGGAEDPVIAIPYVPGGVALLVAMVTTLEAVPPPPTVTCAGDRLTVPGDPLTLRLIVMLGPGALTVRIFVTVPPR
jgi:hypothetical protein